ncbi:MAG: DUF4252 domain-containing protein [Bacteroidales bacterium]|nr:DUF4252 domain-containing protein [Bacteroidales bacterium]
MKLKIFFISICALFCQLSMAQSDLFKRYADKEGVSSVYVSKAMIQMATDAVSNADLYLNNMKGKIEGIQIVSSDNAVLKNEMDESFRKLIGNQHEELMRIKDKSGELITFHIKKEGNLITELIMLVNGGDEFSAIQILGKFTMQDIQEITSRKEGEKTK